MDLHEVFQESKLEDSNGRSRRQQTILALAIFAVLATVLLHRSLLPGYTLLPLDLIQTIAPWDELSLGPLENPLISDPFYSFYTRRYFLTESIQAGEFPLWNPYIMSGTPAIANPNFQPFYIPNLVAAVFLPAHHALPWLAWGHLVLTGWLMYGFLRRHRLHWLACLVGGGVWMLNGYIVVWLENPHRLSTLAWLPGIFWAFQIAVEERRYDYAVVGGLLLGLSVLGGQMQFVFASGLILGVYALGQLFWKGISQRIWSPYPLGPLLVIGAIGVGIGTLILLPASEFAAFSGRIRFTPETIQSSRWPWQHFVTLLAPDFYGNPVNAEQYWGPNNYAELTAYFGAAALLISMTALFVFRNKEFLFLALVMTGFVTAVIFGSSLVRIFFLFPGAEFIVLTRLLFLVPLCGSWLVAISVDGWLAGSERQLSLAIAAGILVCLTVVTLWQQSITLANKPGTYADLSRSAIIILLTIGAILLLGYRPQLAAFLLVVIVFVDLLSWGWDFNPVTSVDYLYPENAVVVSLRQDDSLYRVLPLHSKKVVFGPNILSVFDIQTIGGYTPLIQKRYDAVFKAISDTIDIYWLRGGNRLVMSRFDPAVSLLNVKYILSAKPLPLETPVQVEMPGCDTAVSLTSNWQTSSFQATHPGLNRIDILMAPRAVSDETTATFHLWRDQPGGDLVAEQMIILGQQEEPTIHTVFFAPVADAAGQTFVWGLRGDASTAVCATYENELAYAAYSTQLNHQETIDGIWIYENPNVVPRAYLVHHAEVADSEAVLEQLQNPSFNHHNTVLLAEPLPAAQEALLAPQPVRASGAVEIRTYGLQKVELSVTNDNPGVLVLADAYYPGWEVKVNGENQDILRVNEVYRGVFLPTGSHSVTFRFRPRPLYQGMTIATLTVLVSLVAFIVSRKKRKIDLNRYQSLD